MYLLIYFWLSQINSYISEAYNWYKISFMNIKEKLKSSGKKVTPERVKLFEYMNNVHLFESKDLVEAFPDVWRASIFRTVKLFCEIWVLRRIYLWDNHEKYEIECCKSCHHEHMKCTACWEIMNFSSPTMYNIIFAEAKKLGFQISEHSVNILGTCDKCSS